MRTIVAWTMTLAVGAWISGIAQAQQQQPQSIPPATKRAVAPPAAAGKTAQPAAAPTDPNAVKVLQEAFIKAQAEMDTLLADWEKMSKKVYSLDVAFERIDRAKAWGDQYFQGRAMLKSPDLACLEFTKIKLDANGKPLMVTGRDGKPAKAVEAEPAERIVCTGKEVLQYFWDDRKVFVFPLDKQVRQKALQQGPLPFLFNMKADDAKKRYSMTLKKQSDKEYLIEIIPNLDIDKDSFSLAYLWLSKETYLPNQLWLYPVGKKERQEFRFTGDRNAIKPNVAMDSNFFAFTKIPGWKVILNPGEPGQGVLANPAQGAGAGVGAQPKRQAAQPAAGSTTRPQ
jgi:TIGR03009 family protein